MWQVEGWSRVVRERDGNGPGGVRPGCQPPAERVLVVAVHYRTDLTMRQIAPLVAVSPATVGTDTHADIVHQHVETTRHLIGDRRQVGVSGAAGSPNDLGAAFRITGVHEELVLLLLGQRRRAPRHTRPTPR